jgi:hypothetical protein
MKLLQSIGTCRAIRFALLGLLAFSSALAQKVVIEYDHDVDFSKYRRYDWKEHPFLKNHPESKQFTVGTDLVKSDTNQILMQRGYQPGEPEAEFYIALFITAKMGQDVHSVPVPSAYPGAYGWPGSWYTWSNAWFPAWDTYVENYVQGILLLDVVDAKTNKLLWRAACKAKIDDMAERHKVVEDTVKKAWKKFPPEFKPKK